MCGVFAEILMLTHRKEMQFASSVTQMSKQFFVKMFLFKSRGFFFLVTAANYDM